MARRQLAAAIALCAIVAVPVFPTWGASLMWMPIVLAVYSLVRVSGRPVLRASVLTGILFAVPLGLVGSLGTGNEPSIIQGVLFGSLVMGVATAFCWSVETLVRMIRPSRSDPAAGDV